MEEFSPSLAKEFMEHLKAECSSLAAIGDLAVKLKTLQIVFDITSATKYFESLLKKLQLHPLHNIDKDMAWISCNYMGTGLKMPISEIDFNDFRNISPEIMVHCVTWSWSDKKK